METLKVDFGGSISKGFDLWKANLGVLVLATLLVLVLSIVTVGVLAGPMAVGLILIILRIVDGGDPKPAAGDVFKGFSFFLQSLLYVVVWGVISKVVSLVLALVPAIGPLLSIAFSLGLGTLLAFGLFLIAEKQMAFWPASMESINLVKTNFWPLLGLIVVGSVIGSLGVIACGVGLVFSLPVYFCIVTVVYRDNYGQDEAVAAEEATAGE